MLNLSNKAMTQSWDITTSFRCKGPTEHWNIFRELWRDLSKEEKKWVENVQQIRIIRPIYTDGLFCLLCTLINGDHCFTPLPGCLKIATAVLPFYLFPLPCFSFLPYFMSQLSEVDLFLQGIFSIIGLFLFINSEFFLYYWQELIWISNKL